MKSCSKCAHWEDFGPDEDGQAVTDGFCHRYPKTRYQDVLEDAETPMRHSFSFPVTVSHDWCGEWKRFESAQAIIDQLISPQSGVVDRIPLSGLMKPEEAAEYLQITPATLAVWRSNNRKKLAFVKIGGQVRYRREDLDKFIADGVRNDHAT